MASDTDHGVRHRVTHSMDDSVSSAVIRAVAAASDEDPTEMDTLYSAVDPDALDALCGASGSGPGGNRVTIEFDFNGHRVRLTGDGEIFVFESE